MSEDLVALRHVLEAIQLIDQYASAGHAEYLHHSHLRDSIVRRLEIIGEASKRLSARCRELAPEVQWRRVAGLRDILIHRYWEVDEDQVWKIVERDLPVLKTAVLRLLEAFDRQGCGEP
jgi:uncharacterized protein with HEPN domain